MFIIWPFLFYSVGTTCSSGSTTETFFARKFLGWPRGPKSKKPRKWDPLGPVGICLGPHVKFDPIRIGSIPNPSTTTPITHSQKNDNLKTSSPSGTPKIDNPKLPEGPKPIRIIRRSRYGPIPAGSITLGPLTGHIRHLVIFGFSLTYDEGFPDFPGFLDFSKLHEVAGKCVGVNISSDTVWS